MGKIGPKFSQIVLVRLEGGDPPPKAVSLTAFSVFFLTLPLIGLIMQNHGGRLRQRRIRVCAGRKGWQSTIWLSCTQHPVYPMNPTSPRAAKHIYPHPLPPRYSMVKTKGNQIESNNILNTGGVSLVHPSHTSSPVVAKTESCF